MAGEFRPLYANEIECRIGQVNAKGCSLLLYKTARTDANLLDEVLGYENWQNDYKTINDVLFCGIGVRTGKGDWVWKWDAGSESNVEKEKGEASDAFKRSGTRFGIGRELYTSPFIWIPADRLNSHKEVNGRWTCYDRFRVASIEYIDGAIVELTIENATKGGIVFFWTSDKAPLPEGEDSKSWNITTDQAQEITARVKLTFGDHPLRREAFEAVTGYTVQQLQARAIPADSFDHVMSVLTLEKEDAQRVLDEIGG